MPLTLVVMAAGAGSRFGGPKQLEPVGPAGETLIDYVLHDAAAAGFVHAVLVVREDIAASVATIGARHTSRLRISLAQQVLATHRPRGTVAAVLAAADHIAGPFAVLNADDFYGAAAYRRAAAFLDDPAVPVDTHGVIALPLAATLSPHGGVVRAVCDTNGDALVRLDEVRDIARDERGIAAGDRRFRGDERVSMNFWAFQPAILTELAREFDRFSRAHDARHELPLPVAIDDLIADGRARVRVLDAPGPWIGLTHPSDLPGVREALAAAGYPRPAWPGPAHPNENPGALV